MNQLNRIYLHMKTGGAITPLEALKKYGCFRLGARVHELRKMGYDVRKKMVQRGNKRVAEYWLR